MTQGGNGLKTVTKGVLFYRETWNLWFGNHVFEAGINVSEWVESLESSTMIRIHRGPSVVLEEDCFLGQGQL